MKKTILLITLCFLTLNCSIPPVPNPGFRVQTLEEYRKSFFILSRPLNNSRTHGKYDSSPYRPTGDISEFTKDAQFHGAFDVDRGIAPGLWYVTAISGWEGCDGQSVFKDFERGVENELVCGLDYSIRFPFAPSTVYQYSQPVEIQATINNVDTSYGMPIFHFEDYTGQLMATTNATQVNGTDVRISSGSLTNMPVGTYSVKAYNAPSPNSFNRPIGTSTIVVQPKPPADLAVWRPSNGYWYVLNSSNQQMTSFQWGVSTDIPVRGDFDADGTTDFCVFRPSDGFWHQMRSSNNQYVSQQFGANGDIPVPADYDGDGKTDVAVFRPSELNWIILKSSDATVQFINFGVATDKPVPADYDGDGKADVAQYRKSTADWFVLKSGSNNAFWGQQWGQANTDEPVIGDYDGDGKYDFATWRTGSNTWNILKSSDYAALSIAWGDTSIDTAVQGDFDADGKTDIAVWRKTSGSVGLWQIRNSSTGLTRTDNWGTNGDIPVPAPYSR